MLGRVLGRNLGRMARTINRLTPRGIKALKDRGLYADGGGLYLKVDAGGAKRWVFIFRWNGKRREMGLGSAGTVDLADARTTADTARTNVHNGIDPIRARDALRAAESPATFAKVAADYIRAHRRTWKSRKHALQWTATLKRHTKTLRPIAIGSIETGDILKVLKPIWREIPETASRIRGRIEKVLDAAKAKGLRTGENPARWRGHMEHMLPARARLTRGHHAAMPYPEVGPVLMALSERDSMGARALEFTILTGARTGETLGMTWVEVDLVEEVWTVPAERMKNGKEHRVPLTKSAVEVLNRVRIGNLVPDAYVFPGRVRGRPMSNMAMGMILRKMDLGQFTVHGFRSAFSDWAHDTTNFPGDIIEQALAHTVGNAVKRAYRRGDAFVKRRKLMEAWAGFLTRPAASNVSPMRRPAD